MTDVTSCDGTRPGPGADGTEGAPTVGRVHGLGLSTDSWGEDPARPAGAHRVMTYDLRGHMRSPSTRPRAPAGTTPASVGHDGLRLAPDLDVPSLVLHDSADPEVPGGELREPVSALPDVELVTFPGAGHVRPFTSGPEVARNVARRVATTMAAPTTTPQEAT
ncbi:alpha/beta hydrolase [Geodermatophilus sp. DF01-2]|uniref:alpha/beta fold hydrolase n=1 Tax=Geodermatophilus sp. DF01-2 TaxID=2559610 RepID=UPI001073E369|nr:alpha/beta hydrolase [Geodermatophilus sp. DF01_2]TFV57706.1 alpha/beta hydrolase [Geodermatophilus sp. DF01_2]